MKQSVRDAFVEFSSRFEGVVPWCYLDVKGLVTVGIGNLIDPIETALGLPFVHKGTATLASRDEIRAEWMNVKIDRNPDGSDRNAARRGHLVLQTVTQLRLTPEGVQTVVQDRLALNENILRSQFPDFEDWPADAQLATHSLAWACGPYFPRLFPRLAVMLHQRDFADAARECQMDTRGNAGLVPRNAANRTLFELAARVVAEGLDPEALLFGDDAAPTERSVVTPAQSLAEAETVHPAVPLPERE